MSTSVDLTALIGFPEGSEAWDQLRPELPQHSTLLSATLHIEPNRQYMLLTYRGSQAVKARVPTDEGDIETVVWKPHERKSQQRVPLTSAQAWALLSRAYPQIIPNSVTPSEADMYASPEATIRGFVSSTGKKHLIGETNPDNSYVTTACSSSFAHGQTATFQVRDLSCAKCRKMAGLE